MRPFRKVFVPEGVFGHDSFGVGQYFVKFTVPTGLDFAIVDFHAIVQVEVNLVQGQVAQLGIIVLTFLDLLLHLFQPLFRYRYFMGRMAVVDNILHAVDFIAVNPFHAVEIIGTDAPYGVFIIAMEIDESFKAVFLTAVKEPVNRAFLIGLAVVLEEILEEIVAELFLRCRAARPQGIREECQVSLEVFPSKAFFSQAQMKDDKSSSKYSSSVMGTTLSLSGIKV